LFEELEVYRSFELLRHNKQREQYLMTNLCRIIGILINDAMALF